MIRRILDWLTAGYPKGVPPTERYALIALLKRTLTDDELVPTPMPEVDLPLLVAAAAHGSTVIAVVDRRPPLVVSTDGGQTFSLVT